LGVTRQNVRERDVSRDEFTRAASFLRGEKGKIIEEAITSFKPHSGRVELTGHRSDLIVESDRGGEREPGERLGKKRAQGLAEKGRKARAL